MLPLFKKASWLFGFTVLLIALFLPGYTKLQELRDKNRELEKNIKKLNTENSLLQDQLQWLEKDPLYQEKVAREKMGVVRKGEIPVKIIPEERR